MNEGPRHCPVEGCSGYSATQTVMIVHLWNRDVQDTVVILEDGNLPHQWFPLCDTLVPWQSFNKYHKITAQCKKGEEQKQRGLVAEEERAVTSRAFSAYVRTLDMVPPFK